MIMYLDFRLKNVLPHFLTKCFFNPKTHEDKSSFKGKNPVDTTIILAPRFIGLKCGVKSFIFNVFNISWTKVSLFQWTASYQHSAFLSALFIAQPLTRLEPEPDRIVHGEPWIRQQPDQDPAATGSRSSRNRIQIRMLPDLDPGKPDPDPDIAGSKSGQTGSGSGLSGSRSGTIWC